MARRNVYILTGVVLVLLAALYWFLLLSPLRAEISETEELIEQERQQLQVAQTKLAQMEQTRFEAKRNNARLIELAKMVPVEQEVPSLLLQVQDLAAESGIEFLSIAPAQEVTEAALSPIPLTLSFKGTFFDVNDFLYRAEQLAAGPGRLLATSEIELSASEVAVGVSPELQVNLILDAYERSRPVNLEPVAPEPPEPLQASNEGEAPIPAQDAAPDPDGTGDQATAAQPN